MGVGLDDYVIGREGNGYYLDRILADSAVCHYQGRLVCDRLKVTKGQAIDTLLPPHCIRNGR